MKNWFKCLFACKEEQQKKDEEYVVSRKDISEPVLSIVKTFSEKGRWKISHQGNPIMVNLYNQNWSFTITDTKTEEVYHLASRSYYSSFSGLFPYMYLCFPRELMIHTLPSWMTHTEKTYVYEEFEKISKQVGARMEMIEDRRKTKDEKQAQVNKDKERARLKGVYCK